MKFAFYDIFNKVKGYRKNYSEYSVKYRPYISHIMLNNRSIYKMGYIKVVDCYKQIADWFKC